MKDFIVIRHSDGSFESINAQFDSEADASMYANLAAQGNPGWTYEVYKRGAK